MTELKRCLNPDCDKIPVLRFLGVGKGDYIITCDCGLMLSAQATESTKEPEIAEEIKNKIIQAWNTRPAPDVERLAREYAEKVPHCYDLKDFPFPVYHHETEKVVDLLKQFAAELGGGEG